MLYALDLGNKQIKLKSEKVERVLPSYFIESELYGNRSFNVLADAKDTKDFESVHDSGVKYVWGTDLDLTTDITDSGGFGLARYKSREFKLITDFALAELAIHDVNGEETLTVDVVTGLPTEDYMNPKIKEQVATLIKGKHLVTVGDRTLTIVVDKLLIIPQSLGTVYDIIADETGTIIDESFDGVNIGIVDVGGGTVLIDGFRSLNMAYDKRVQTTNGAYSLYRNIITALNNSDIHISEYELENTIRKNEGIWSPDKIKQFDLNPVIQDECKKYTRRLSTTVKSAYKGFGSLQKIIFTGGTANLLDVEELEESLSDLATPIIASSSELSNVRGFHKFAMHKMVGIDA